MYAIDVHADRRIVPLCLGIIIHLESVDYCIIMLHGPFHSLYTIMYNVFALF